MVDKNIIIQGLRKIYDPEIPVNIYDLGLIYNIEIDEKGAVNILMTLTSPNCPVAESLPIEVSRGIAEIDGVTEVYVNLTFTPSWNPDNLSDDVKLDLGLFF